MVTEIVVVNLEKVEKKLSNLEKGLAGPIQEKALNDALAVLVEESAARAPVWRGDIKSSIQGVVSRESNMVTGVYSVRAAHGIYQEFGTPGPRFVPAKFIGDWAVDHGFGYTGLIVSGRPQPFVRRSDTEKLFDVADRTAKQSVEFIEQGIKDIL